MDPIAKVIKVAGKDALTELQKYRKDFDHTQLYPFIVGTDDELATFREYLSPPEDGGAAYIAEAATINAAEWLKSKAPKSRTAWPKKPIQPITAFSSLYDVLSNVLKPEVNIAFVQVQNSWEVFAKLGYGDWNDCPAPHIHVALHHYWAETYKSSPIAISSDIVECYAPLAPSEQKDALKLAREHFAYCYDIVEQGTGTVGKLASSLQGSKIWYFWWD